MNSYFGRDSATQAIEVVEYSHHEIHGGSSYTTCKIFTHGVGASPNILVVTPNTTKWAHFQFQAVSDDILQVDFYETPDYSGGSALTAHNRERNSSNTSGLTLTTDATDGGGGKGTLIWTFKAGANNTIADTGGERREFILKQNEKYLIEFVGANGDIITALLNYYEHTNKN